MKTHSNLSNATPSQATYMPAAVALAHGGNLGGRDEAIFD